MGKKKENSLGNANTHTHTHTLASTCTGASTSTSTCKFASRRHKYTIILLENLSLVYAVATVVNLFVRI